MAGMPIPVGRLAAFTVLSIALHAITLGAYVPGSAGSGADIAAAPVLHAILAPRDSGNAPAAQHDSTSPAQAGAQSATALDHQQARGGAGPDMPLPDKWYTASELDVRAQPLTPEKLDYPAELGPLGPAATVRVTLFIDERGFVRKTQLVDGAPVAAFDRAALEAFRDVRFSPAVKNGVPVKSQKLLELDFRPDLAIR